MKLGNFKNFSLKKKDAAAAPDEVLIESTTAEQIAEMKQRLAGRTKDLEEAKTQLSGLSSPADDDDDDDDNESVGPHPPLQELTLEDIDEDEDDDFVLAPDAPGEEPIKVVNVKASDAEESEEEEPEEEDDEEEGIDGAGGGDDLKNLFSQDEEEEHPLANLINFLPDVSVQELVDDIEEIKSIIKEWQQQR